MKEAFVSKGPVVEIVDSPIPEPNDDQVLIKVVVSGSNPKDWKIPHWLGTRANQGDDIGGIVEKVGKNVVEFQPGDRVAAFHEMQSPHGSYAEYAIAWANTTFHIPNKLSFEEAAALPLAAMTSAVALYLKLGLPEPWRPATASIPLVIYGASSAVGAYAVQLAQRSNIHPVIAVAGKASAFVETLIDRKKGDTIIDYRQGEEHVVSELKKALSGEGPNTYVLDAISEQDSTQRLIKVLAPGAKATFVLPVAAHGSFADGVETSVTSVGCVHKDDKDFGYLFFRYIGHGLEAGWFHGHPTEVVPGGLGGVQTALENLQAGKASAIKYVFRIADTEGVKA